MVGIACEPSCTCRDQHEVAGFEGKARMGDCRSVKGPGRCIGFESLQA